MSHKMRLKELKHIWNYLRSGAVFKGKIPYTPEMRSDAIDCAQGHADITQNNKLIELKSKIINELRN